MTHVLPFCVLIGTGVSKLHEMSTSNIYWILILVSCHLDTFCILSLSFLFFGNEKVSRYLIDPLGILTEYLQA